MINPLRSKKFPRTIDKHFHIEATPAPDFISSYPPIHFIQHELSVDPYGHICTHRLHLHLRPLILVSSQTQNRHRVPKCHSKFFFYRSVKLHRLRQKFVDHRTGLEVFSSHRIHQSRSDPRRGNACLTIDDSKIHPTPPQLPRKASAGQTLSDNCPVHTIVTYFGHKASFGSFHDGS